MHTVLPSPCAQSGYRVSGKEVEVHDSGSRHHQLCCCNNLQLIQSHVVPSRGPPARVLSPLFFQAKSLLLPKPRGKREHPKAVWSSPFSAKAMWSSPFSAKAMWSSPGIAAVPGFKSQRQSSSAAPFLTPSTISSSFQSVASIPYSSSFTGLQ